MVVFDAVKKELQDILNNNPKNTTYGIFNEYDLHQDHIVDDLNRYDNLGVLYVNYGSLQLLEGNSGMTGTIRLELLMGVKDGYTSSTPVTEPLYSLMESSNGRLKTMIADKDYSYVMNVHLPTSDGVVEFGDGTYKYVRHNIIIDITVSSDFILGNLFDLQFFNTNTQMWQSFPNMTMFLISPNKQLSTMPFIETESGEDDDRFTSFATQKVWGASVQSVFTPSNAIHADIYANAENLEKTYQIRYTYKGASANPSVAGDYVAKTVIVNDVAINAQKGVFVTLQFTMAEAKQL